MSVDLRELLQERSANMELAVDRVAEVHRRIGAVRRRRAAGMVAGVLVVVGAVAAAWTLLPGGTVAAPPIPAATTRTIDGFPEYTLGARVVATAVAELPQTSVAVTIVPESLDLAFSWWCTPGMWSEVSWDDSGHYVGTDCGEEPSTSVFPEGAAVWAERGLVVGQPATFTLTVTHIHEYTEVGPVDHPLPDSGTLALAVMQRLPFAEYPLPSPPATLIPIDPDEGRAPSTVVLTADDDDPHARARATFTWAPGQQLLAVSQTPGYLHITVNGVPLPTFEWWDYDANDSIIPLDGWEELDIEDGTVVTLTVTLEHVTGDWFVLVQDPS